MQRYLFHFGYLGTRFNGIPKSSNTTNSIADYVEKAMECVISRSYQMPIITFSSRTDTGVHGLSSTFHLDLPFTLSCSYISSRMNKYFTNSSLDIRIHKVESVPQNFHCRFSAVRRSYLYRLAHHEWPRGKDHLGYLLTPKGQSIFQKQLPISEVNRCQLISGDFNVEAVQEACQILKGYHDFRYYAGKIEKSVRTERTLMELKIVPGSPLFGPDLDPQYEGFTFWDVVMSSRGFLYNQVRRTVAVLVAVGNGLFSLEDVETTIKNPHMGWDRRLTKADPDGLYLLGVEYPPEAFLEETETDSSSVNTLIQGDEEKACE